MKFILTILLLLPLGLLAQTTTIKPNDPLSDTLGFYIGVVFQSDTDAKIKAYHDSANHCRTLYRASRSPIDANHIRYWMQMEFNRRLAVRDSLYKFKKP